jgi:hypothetical protein
MFVDVVIYNYLGIQILKIVYFLQNIISIRHFQRLLFIVYI